jgi:hypothetical protein
MVLNGFDADPSLLSLPLTDTWNSLAKPAEAISPNRTTAIKRFISLTFYRA